MNTRRLSMICLVVCIYGTGLCQSWVIENIGTKEGLLSPDVWSVYHDSHNLLWAGTVAGLSSFDGFSFRNYSHAADGSRIGKVKSMDEDREGNLWVGSDQGLFRWHHGAFHKLAGDLNINAVIFSLDGTLWLGCEDGLHFSPNPRSQAVSMDTTSIIKFTASIEKTFTDNRITDIQNKPDGSLLISTYYAIYHLKESALKLIWGSPNIKPDIVSIAVVSDDIFYWACDESHFYEFRYGEIKALENLNHIPADVYPYRTGVCLLAGALYYYRDGRSELIIEDHSTLDWMRKLVADGEGNIWIATFEGLVKIKPSPFTLYPNLEDQIESEIYSLFQNSDYELLFGGNRGRLSKLQDDQLVPYFSDEKRIVPSAEIFDIYEVPGGALWFGSGYQGIARLSNGSLQNFTIEDGLADNSRYFFFENRAGNLFTGGDGGITQILQPADASPTFKNYTYDLENLNSYVSYLTALETPDERLWFAGTHGLMTLRDEQLQNAKIFNSSLTSPHITDLILDKDHDIWISTIGDGILHCGYGSDSIYLKQQFSLDDGLPSNAFLNLIEDQTGTIWAGAYQGICRIKKHREHQLNIRFYDLKDGFLPQNFSALKLFEDKAGIIWGGSPAGIFSLDPKNLLPNDLPPNVMLTQVELIDVDQPWENYATDFTTFYGLPVDPILPHHINDISLHFTAASLSKPSDLAFRYRLDGLDAAWQINAQRSVTYRQIPPGSYTFLVQAKNEDGVWSSDSATFNFTILPAIWQRRYIQIILVLGTLFFLYRIFKLYDRRNKQQELEKTVAYFANSNYGSNTVDEILWDVARNVISRLNFEDCVVYVMHPSGNYLNQVAAYGDKNPQGRTIANPIQLPVGTGIVGHAAATQKPILVADCKNDPRYIVDLEQKGSELAVPIIHEGEVLGVIDSENSKKHYFDRAHVRAFQKIAEHCAHKIAAAQAAEAMAKKEKEILNIQKEIAESKLTALQAQMNPHFIFNSLNSINWYIVKNRSLEASQYLTKFSKLVRLILDNSKNFTISLAQELEALRLYLDLESMRFEDRFKYQIQADASVELEEVQIPPLILQPFIENAIWHGLLHKKEKGELTIQIYPENGHLRCIVQDNGIGRKAAAAMQERETPGHQSKGMKLTSARIQLMHEDFLKADMVRIIDLEDENGIAAGTRVEVLLPYDEV